MKKLHYSQQINATANKVWQVLWSSATYPLWTEPFSPGSHAVSDWQAGSPVQFLNADGNGMHSEIVELNQGNRMVFRHLAEIRNGEVQPHEAMAPGWHGAVESYQLTEENGVCKLDVELDSTEEYESEMNATFPKALEVLKQLAEQPVQLHISAMVEAPVALVWNTYTGPDHICRWNHASDDWHATSATNDLRIGGRFVSRMEAKDGSFGFDFGGTYTNVIPEKLLAYTMDDQRTVEVTFEAKDNGCLISGTFVAEDQNSYDMQVFGWQAILNNFKAYTENLNSTQS